MPFQLCPLHERRDLTDECVRVINSEWPRSKALRLHSMEKSCSTLPYSLVMTEIIENEERKEHVVGYCRFVKVLGQKKSVLIETVVVDKERRGQGLGRKLMELAESQALKSGYDTMYLCTTDKQTFYEHLGYQYCKPVNTLGAQMLESCDCSMGCTNTPLPCEDGDDKCQPTKKSCPPNESDVTENDVGSHISESSLPLSPPPPPPPLPPPLVSPAPVVYWLTKTLKVT